MNGKIDDVTEHELSLPSSYHNIKMKRFSVYHEKEVAGRLREKHKETLRKHSGKELLIRDKLNNKPEFFVIIQWFTPPFFRIILISLGPFAFSSSLVSIV